jgi:hypothetical protein
MTKTKSIPFADLRRFLQGLGYTEKCTDSAHVFHRAKQDLLFYRRYRDQEMVDQRDLLNTRKFLDSWGLLDESDFDAFLERANTPA